MEFEDYQKLINDMNIENLSLKSIEFYDNYDIMSIECKSDKNIFNNIRILRILLICMKIRLKKNSEDFDLIEWKSIECKDDQSRKYWNLKVKIRKNL